MQGTTLRILAAAALIVLLVCKFSWSIEPEIIEPAEIEKLSPTEYMEIRNVAVNGSPLAKHNAFVQVFENSVELREFVPEALEFLQAAADAGIPDAQYNLGFLYRTGEWVQKDPEMALQWLELSASSGHVRAQLWSGITYLDQYYATAEGPKADQLFARGEKWLRMLIESGESCDECLTAKEMLGRALLSRSLIDPEGWELLKEAASAGHKGAIRTLHSLEETLLDFESKGYEPAPALLEELRQFLQSLDGSSTGY